MKAREAGVEVIPSILPDAEVDGLLAAIAGLTSELLWLLSSPEPIMINEPELFSANLPVI